MMGDTVLLKFHLNLALVDIVSFYKKKARNKSVVCNNQYVVVPVGKLTKIPKPKNSIQFLRVTVAKTDVPYTK